MRNLTTEDTYVFTYENWLSKTKGPKRTKVCELAAVVDEEEMVEQTSYIIQVQTSDVGGESFMDGPISTVYQRETTAFCSCQRLKIRVSHVYYEYMHLRATLGFE